MATLHFPTTSDEHFERLADEVFLATAILGAAAGAWVASTLGSGGGEAVRLLSAATGAVAGSMLGTTLGRWWLLPLLYRWEHRHR